MSKCSRCNLPAEDGLSTCLRHSHYEREKHKRQYKEKLQAGLCARCGRSSKLESEVLCKKCVETMRENKVERQAFYSIRERERKRERLAAGICPRCGLEPLVDKRKLGEHCLEKDRLRK